MRMNYYIGADLGTSSLKLMLVCADGTICKSVSREYEVIYPKIGFLKTFQYIFRECRCE